MDTSGFAYKRFVDILETFDFVQHIDKPTRNSCHLLDYIITRKGSSGVSNLYVSDCISDHRALHVSLTCSRAHPERKKIEVRSLKRIQCDVLDADIIGVNIDRECTNVNLVVRQYGRLCLILLVCCVGCHRAQFWDQLNFVCICFHLVRYLVILTRLNMCISDIRVWMIKKKINDSKTEFKIFRSPLLKQNLSDLSVSVGDIQVSPSSKVRDLGVVFDQYLTFHDHISGICKSTHFHLRGIGRIRNLLTFDATAQLIHALITSRLDFCNSILYNLPNKQIERLQRIQNQAARMLKRIPRRNHITPVLRELHWLRIHDRIIFKILLLTHKAANNTAPEYLCDLIRLNVKSTRASFDPCLLCVPPISKTCANSFFDRSFVYAAPTLWNALDLDIRLLWLIVIPFV